MRGLQRRFSPKGSGLQRRILLLCADCFGPPVEKTGGFACRTTVGGNLRANFSCRFPADAANGAGVLHCRLSLDPAYPTPIAAPPGIGVSGAGTSPGSSPGDRAILGAIT